jgi:hypothetical protein
LRRRRRDLLACCWKGVVDGSKRADVYRNLLWHDDRMNDVATECGHRTVPYHNHTNIVHTDLPSQSSAPLCGPSTLLPVPPQGGCVGGSAPFSRVTPPPPVVDCAVPTPPLFPPFLPHRVGGWIIIGLARFLRIRFVVGV